MAQKLGKPSWWSGQIYERAVIDRNAQDLAEVEVTVGALQAVVQRQEQEILRLRAMLIGLVEVLHTRTPFYDGELDRAAEAAWTLLTGPAAPLPSPAASTDPYRGLPAEPAAPAARVVLCLQCGRKVPASQTTITENGEVCDACA